MPEQDKVPSPASHRDAVYNAIGNAAVSRQSKPSVQSDCKRDQKEGDQPGNDLLIVSARRKDPHHQ